MFKITQNEINEKQCEFNKKLDGILRDLAEAIGKVKAGAMVTTKTMIELRERIEVLEKYDRNKDTQRMD